MNDSNSHKIAKFRGKRWGTKNPCQQLTHTCPDWDWTSSRKASKTRLEYAQ